MNLPRKAGDARASAPRFDIAGALLAAAVPLVLFLVTLYPGVGGRTNVGDSAKLQYIGEVLGIPHEPGYPLYVILNFLFTRLPLPFELAVKVNLLSAVFSLASGVLVFATLRRLGVDRWFSVLGTWTLLLSLTVWTFSTEAEVYSLHLLFVSASFFLALRWLETRDERVCGLFLAVVVLSLSHHPTAWTMLPGVAWLVVLYDRSSLRRPRVWGAVAIAVATVVALLAFMVWRANSGVVFVEALPRWASPGDLLSAITGHRFAERRLLLFGGDEVVRRLFEMGSRSIVELGPPALVLAAVALAKSPRRSVPWLVFVLLAFIGQLAFVAAYHIGDWRSYKGPLWLVVILVAGAGTRYLESKTARRVVLALWLGFLGVTVPLTLSELHVDDRRFDPSGLARAVGSDAIVVSKGGYRWKQLNNYFNYGSRFPETRDLEFASVTRVFDREFLFLQERRLVFDNPKVREFFDLHEVDYVHRVTTEGERYYETGNDWAVDSIRVVSRPNRGLRVMDNRGRVLADGTHPVEIGVIDPIAGRVRGVKGFTLREIIAPKRYPGVLSFLYTVQPSDWLFVVVQARDLVRYDDFMQILARFLHQERGPDLRPRTSYFVAGVKESMAQDAVVEIDFEGSMIVDVSN